MAVKITIDKREMTVEPGTTVLHAASGAGIDIPHLCYHEELSAKGSCRICLVEIEGNPKLQPACSTCVCDGMVVRTDTPAVREARSGVLEMLLLNHPLDCPVCDKGGECKLQDYVFAYGRGRGRFRFEKRTFSREDIGPFVVRDMNRCVHCTRCVRFTSEITLTEDIGVFDRGNDTSIGTYLGRELRNPFSGNVTELCPVGALTDRVFRFKARVWELEDAPSVCPLCPAGCPTQLQLDEGRIVRVRNREGGSSPWICDLGRFGFAAASSEQRQSFIREDEGEVSVPWDVALGTVSGRFRVISKESGPDSVGVLCSTLATNEELFGLQYVLRNVLKSHNIDFRARAATPVSREGAQVLSEALEAQGQMAQIQGCESVILFCCDPFEETPVAGLHIVRAARSGARVMSIGPRRPSPRALSSDWFPVVPEHGAVVLASLARELAGKAVAKAGKGPSLRKAFEDLAGFSLERASELTGIKTETLRSVVDVLRSSGTLGLVVGREVFSSPSVYLVLSSVLRICAIRSALGIGETVLLSLLGEGNVRGALEFGAFPALLRVPSEWKAGADSPGETKSGERGHHGDKLPAVGRSLSEMIEAARSGKLRALFVFGCDPLTEYDDRKAAEEALKNVEFLVVQSESVNETARIAHAYLPLQGIFERDGTVMSLDGRLRALSPQVSDAGSRSLLFDVLDSVCKAMGESSVLRDAASTFQEMRRLYGWDFAEDLEELAGGQGVRVYETSGEPSETWIPAREFEKEIKSGEAASSQSEYPYVLITGAAGVSSWVWARAVSSHELVPGEAFAEISEDDAEKLGVSDGGLVEIASRTGSVRVRSVSTKHLIPGVVFLPSGFADARANLLTVAGEPTTNVRLKRAGA